MSQLSFLVPGVIAAAVVLAADVGLAADHAEAPGTEADAAADIADLYAWHTDDGALVAALTFAGLGPAGVQATYDEEVLYGIHIDNDGDSVADIDIWARFGQDDQGNWGVKFQNIPGAGAAVSGPVEQVIASPGGSVYAGLRDDPFFFDLQGFNDTATTGVLSFDSTRDSLEGTNVTALVVEMDLGAATDGAENIQIWATSSRL